MARAGKWLFALFVVLTLVGVYNAASGYFEERAAKKAEIDEYWRRERLTPEQRIAENKARADAAIRAAEAAKLARRQAEEKELEATGRAMCLAWWEKSLRDPDSAKVEESGGVLSNGTYYGHITGRAKNGFGGYVRATWDCQLVRNGTGYLPLTLSQRR